MDRMNSSKAFNKITKYKMDMFEENPYIGCWKILYFDLNDDQKQVKLSTSNDDIKFELKANDFSSEHASDASSSDETDCDDYNFGDITWHVLPNNTLNETIRPIFECNSFECDSDLHVLEFSSSNFNLEFDISFEAVEPNDSKKNSLMVLSNNQGGFKLICQRLMDIDNFDKTYSFCEIYNNEFMSDVKIKSASGRYFHAHKTILTLTLKENMEKFVQHLNQLRQEPELIDFILFYLYNGCLSNKLENINFKVNQDQKLDYLIKFAQKYPELEKFKIMLETFLNNNSFKEGFKILINDIKKCCESLNAKIKYNESIQCNNQVFSDPAKFVQILKFCFKQITIALIKIIRLLNLYADEHDQLSKEEKTEFTTEIENCLPFFIEQFKQLLTHLQKHCERSTEQERREVAEYLVPELDKFVDNMLNLIRCWEDSIEKIISDKKAKNSKSSKKYSDEEENDQEVVVSQKQGKKLKKKLGKSINTAMHVRDLKKIQKFSSVIKKKIAKLESSLKQYQKTNQNSKSSLIFKELNNITNNFISDTPTLLVKIDNFAEKIKTNSKNSSKKKKFRYTFKISSTRIQWLLNELRKNNSVSKSLISQLVDNINSREFTAEIEKLRLGKSNQNDKKLGIQETVQARLTNKNCLAKEATKLFRSKYLCDVVLHVIDDNRNTADFNVHGVIVASRCAWFYRALSSGMKESINRKVTLYDSNLKLFEIFIQFLYSGYFDSDNKLDNNELIGLLTLADKYECHSLKSLIEHRLMNSLETFPKIFNNSDWIVDLVDIMILSEQFDLKDLMSLSMDIMIEMMKENNVKMDREEFDQLNENLKKILQKKFDSYDTKKSKPKLKHNRKKLLNDIFDESSSDDDIIFSDSFDNVQPLYSNTLGTRQEQLINYAHPLIVADPRLLEDTFYQLKEIIGPDVEIQLNDQELVKLLVQYDYDLNRVVPVVLNCE